MKILVMNSIKFKIPILTATNIILTLYNSNQKGILYVIEFITSIFILFK